MSEAQTIAPTGPSALLHNSDQWSIMPSSPDTSIVVYLRPLQTRPTMTTKMELGGSPPAYDGGILVENEVMEAGSRSQPRSAWLDRGRDGYAAIPLGPTTANTSTFGGIIARKEQSVVVDSSADWVHDPELLCEPHLQLYP